jgi:NDP-sugar pyrophosphorylase family protein
VLARINRAEYLFQIVLDERRRPIGTITDGDIRRAILAGAEMSSAAAEAMSKHPVLGRRNDDAGNREKISRLGMKVAFLPVVGDDGALERILVHDGENRRIATALVMAGGFGKRLGSKTRAIPKPLLPVGGVPILERVLASLEAASVGKVFISVHYLADQIGAFVRRRTNRLDVELVHETAPLGTAGAIALLPRAATQEPMLVVNGDIVTQLDIGALGGFHFKHDFDATIAVQKFEVAIPYGVIRQDESGHFAAIDEKPTFRHFVSAGIYIVSPEISSLVESRRPTDMPEVFSTAKSLGMRVGLFPVHEYWKDIGRPEDLEAADKDYSEDTD